MSKSMEQMEQPVGNTERPARAPKKSRHWFFTLNNPMEVPLDHSQMEQLLHSLGPTKFVFQLEEGDSKTPHYQGCVSVKNPIAMPRNLCPQIHWETTRDWSKASAYCMKDEGRLAGPWVHNVDIARPIKVIETLKPWQEQVKELIDEDPDDRKIHWFWESTGNAGKTAMAKYICKNYNALFLSGKASDAKYAVSEWLEKNGELRVAVFGFTRSVEDYVSYQALEEIKDGLFFNGKYEAKMCIFNSPHVIVFANFPPDQSKLSADRWYVENIDHMCD